MNQIQSSDETPLVHTLKLSAADRPEGRNSMLLTWHQLQKIADDFDLGRMIQMDTPLTTQCNTTDPFKTGRGTFMVRTRHSEEFGSRVEYLHALIDYLCAHDFPAPEVIRTKSGKSWTTWGERIVEIHRFVPHDPGIHRDWQRMHAAASALGDLHKSLAAASSGKTPVAPEMRNDIDPEQCWSLLEEGKEGVQAFVDVPKTITQEAVHLLERAQQAVEPLIKDYSRNIGLLPWMVIHGDYHFWNLLYRGDEIAAVVDYDFMQERERIFDIAYAMQNVIGHMKNIHGSLLASSNQFSRLPWGNVRLWVDQYDSATHLPLTKTERQILPKEILRIYLVSMATGILQEDPLETILRQGQDMDLFTWIAQQENLFC